MNKEEFEKQHPGLKEEMMMEEAIVSAELAKQEYCKKHPKCKLIKVLDEDSEIIELRCAMCDLVNNIKQ